MSYWSLTGIYFNTAVKWTFCFHIPNPSFVLWEAVCGIVMGARALELGRTWIRSRQVILGTLDTLWKNVSFLIGVLGVPRIPPKFSDFLEVMQLRKAEILLVTVLLQQKN